MEARVDNSANYFDISDLRKIPLARFSHIPRISLQ